MAYICNRCRLAVSRRYSNCPSCGFQLLEDSRTLEECLGQGFRTIGKRRPETESSGQGTQSEIHIDDADHLARLRSGYAQSRSAAARLERTTAEIQAPPERAGEQTSMEDGAGAFFRRHGGTHTPAEGTHTAEPAVEQRPQTDTDERFFRRDGGASRPVPEHQEDLRTADRRWDSADVDGGIRPASDRPIRQRGFQVPRVDLRSFWYGFCNVLSLIPWRAVFTLVVICAIVGVVMAIWGMRYEIVKAIVGFAVELLPLGLVIGGIVWLIRCLFR